MREVELLVTLAEIAGVFVGFGALISVRSGGASDTEVVAYIRAVLILGLWVVVAGLGPATLGAYDIAGRDLWLVCGLVGLAGLAVVWATNLRTPEMRELMRGASRARLVREGIVTWVLIGPAWAALILVVLGLVPDRDAALYLSAVVLALFLAGLTLLFLVYAQHPPASASDGAEQPSGGGSSA
jgi:hypothetical protein